MQNEKGFNLAGRSLFIALPAYDFKVSLQLAVSLCQFAQEAPAHGVSIQIGSVCGCSVVSRARNLLAKDFLESACTDLIFIDSDINFKSSDVFRLMAWGSEKGKDIVAGVPRTRTETATYFATLDDDENGDLTMDAMGLVRARRVATAFMLVRREVFTSLEEAHPEWSYYDERSKRQLTAMFDFKVTPDGYMGEDYLFCDRARELGFKVWIDPTIKLGHMGIHEYEGDFGGDVFYPSVVKKSRVA